MGWNAGRNAYAPEDCASSCNCTKVAAPVLFAGPTMFVCASTQDHYTMYSSGTTINRRTIVCPQGFKCLSASNCVTAQQHAASTEEPAEVTEEAASSWPLWVIILIVGGVVVVALGAFLVIRSKRKHRPSQHEQKQQDQEFAYHTLH